MGRNGSNDDGTDNTDWQQVYDDEGRDALLNELADGNEDPNLLAVLNENDTSLDNEDLGLDEDGNREDD